MGSKTWCGTDYYAQIYLDDILVLAIEAPRLREVIRTILELFKDLGILCHPHKCEL